MDPEILRKLSQRQKPMIGNEQTADFARTVQGGLMSFFGGQPAKTDDTASRLQLELLKDSLINPEKKSLELETLKAKRAYYDRLNGKDKGPSTQKLITAFDDVGQPVFTDVPSDVKVLNPGAAFNRPKKENNSFEDFLSGNEPKSGLENFAANNTPMPKAGPSFDQKNMAAFASMKNKPQPAFLGGSQAYKPGDIIQKKGKTFRITQLTEDPEDPEVEEI